MKNNLIKRFVLTIVAFVIGLSLISCDKKTPAMSVQESTPAPQNEQKPTETASLTPVSGNIQEKSFNNADKTRVKAKGLYLTGTSAGSKLQHYIELAKTTEINAYIIDYKNDYGNVLTNSEVPLAKEIKAIDVRYNAEKVTKELRDNNIYSIARIVVFKDPILPKNKPEFAIKATDGSLYVYNKMNWLNPYNKDAWQYSIDLAKEAFAKGFNEVQFDYIRFPEGKKSGMVFGDTGGKNLSETVNAFLSEARKQIPDQILSGDVFAIICESPGDTEGIGQVWETIGKDLDYIYPMAYPSHYALGQIINGVKFPKPDLMPQDLIKQTFLKAKSRLEKVDGHKPGVRAYLQDFTAEWIGKGNWQYYEDAQIRQQIQGLYDAGYDEWVLWDHMNNYREGAFKKE